MASDTRKQEKKIIKNSKGLITGTVKRKINLVDTKHARRHLD